MTVKFSDFVMGSTPRITDIVVGLRGNVNEQFNYNGVADSLGNIIVSYSAAVGPGNPVNYINISNAFSGNSPILSTIGADPNVDLTISLQGLGNVHIVGTGALYLPAGTTGQEPSPVTAGGIRYNTTSNFLEYSDGIAWASLAAGGGLIGTPPITVIGSTISLQTPLAVQYGGTGDSSITAFAPICGGTTNTNPLQSVNSAGANPGYVLTFNGVSALPTWQVAAGTGTVLPGTANQLAFYSVTGSVVSGLATANNGTLVTSNSGVPSILAGTGVTGNVLQSNAAAAPSFSAAVYPSSTVANQILYSNAINNIVGLVSAANGVLITSAGSVPSISSTLPNAVQLNITSTGVIGVGAWQASAIGATFGGTSQTTYTLGDTLYASAANTLSKLAGNITAVKQYLSQTGTGAVSAAPVWATISGGDITGAALTETNDTNVTLTLGGSPSTALLNATSLTLGWTGTLALTRGGLGASLTPNNGGIFYSTGSAGAILNGTSTANQILMSGSNSAPSWSTAVYPTTVAATSLLYTNAANTITSLPSTASSVLIGNGVGNIVFTSSMTNGQLVIGSTGATPATATLTAGTGITVTNGAGTITIASSGSPQTVVDQTTSSVTMSINTIYICDAGASLITFTLPAVVPFGSTFQIVGNSSGGWTIAQNAGQTLHLNSGSTATGIGLASSTNRYNCITLRCVIANTDFTVTSSSGNILLS